MITLQSARKFQELLGTDVETVPYNYAMLFKADGFFARRRAQKRFKLLQAIDEKLRPMLQSNEKVYFLTPGTTVNLSEQFIIGWLAYYLNMHALVFTSNRVLLIQIDGSRRPRELVSQMPYGVIASVRSTWNGLCRVKLVNKQIYKFQHVPAADRKFLSKFLTGVVQGSTAPFQGSLGIEHLCPHCFAVVPGFPQVCPSCHGTFKSGLKAGLLSFLFPGSGDWYLGHRGFALMEIVCTSFLWLAALFLPRFVPQVRDYAPFDKHYWQIAGGTLLAAHLIAGLMTFHFSRKGHYPAGKPPARDNEPTAAATVDMPKPDLIVAKKSLSLRRDQADGAAE